MLTEFGYDRTPNVDSTHESSTSPRSHKLGRTPYLNAVVLRAGIVLASALRTIVNVSLTGSAVPGRKRQYVETSCANQSTVSMSPGNDRRSTTQSTNSSWSVADVA